MTQPGYISHVGKWICSENEEYWNHHPHSDTMEEAIQEHLEAGGLKVDDYFYVAQIKAPEKTPLSSITTGMLMEHLSEEMSYQVGDVAEDWPQFDEDELTEAVYGMLVKTGQWPPPFFTTENTKTVTVAPEGDFTVR